MLDAIGQLIGGITHYGQAVLAGLGSLASHGGIVYRAMTITDGQRITVHKDIFALER